MEVTEAFMASLLVKHRWYSRIICLFTLDPTHEKEASVSWAAWVFQHPKSTTCMFNIKESRSVCISTVEFLHKQSPHVPRQPRNSSFEDTYYFWILLRRSSSYLGLRWVGIFFFHENKRSVQDERLIHHLRLSLVSHPSPWHTFNFFASIDTFVCFSPFWIHAPRGTLPPTLPCSSHGSRLTFR